MERIHHQQTKTHGMLKNSSQTEGKANQVEI